MIDISVSGVEKSFELGKKILDGVTFQIESGERVGLLGKNGAGKTTLFRILTGELEADAGEIVVAPNRRVGLISQIPVYPYGYTVEDVLQSAFSRMRRMAEEMAALETRMADGDEREETLRRYGELSALGSSLGQAFLAEVILTFVFILAILGVTSKKENTAVTGLVIGLTLTLVHILGIPFTGTSVNPARSFGPALIAGGTALKQVWVFILAPLVGSALAACCWNVLRSAKK